jgi:hypothetical protein
LKIPASVHYQYLSITKITLTEDQNVLENEKITHITLNDTNYLPWMHTTLIGLGGGLKFEYVTGELQKSVLVNSYFPMTQEKKTLKE